MTPMEHIDKVAALMLNSPSEGQSLYDRLLREAANQKCKTEFKAAVKARKDTLEGELAAEAAKRAGKAVIVGTSPNEANAQIRAIGKEVGKRHLAYDFGGLNCNLVQSQSAKTAITRRDGGGDVVRDDKGNPIRDPLIVTRATLLTAAAAHVAALDAVAFFQQRDEGTVEAEMPASYHTRALTAWSGLLPPLAGFANHPVWYDGQIKDKNGYDEPTGLFFQSNSTKVEPFEDLIEAVDFLKREWLVDFPFGTDSDLAAAIMLPATILMARTELAGQAGPPMFLITAPSAATGKSFLANVLIAAVTGTFPGSNSYPTNEEERQKHIAAAILDGLPTLFFDNLRSGSSLDNRDVQLTKLITDITYEGRVLGSTKTFSGRADLPVVATGNNIVLDDDMARRVIECRLVAPHDVSLARRTFTHDDLMKWTLGNRGKILGALQTILQQSASREVIGTFPGWGRLVANPVLQALDVKPKEFFLPWDEAAENDADGVNLPGVYKLLQAIAALRTDDVVQDIEGTWFTAAEIIAGINAANVHGLLHLPHREDKLDARSLAHLLKRTADTTYHGEEGSFRVWKKRANLGDRTDRKIRPIFRVQRRTAEAPVMPGYRQIQALEMGWKKKDEKKKKDET